MPSRIILNSMALWGTFILIIVIERPRVDLLNVGEEEDKGNQLVNATTELFQDAPFQFVGNIEGKVVLFDAADVVVAMVLWEIHF